MCFKKDNPDPTHKRDMGEKHNNMVPSGFLDLAALQGRGQAVAPHLVGCSRTDRGVHAEAAVKIGILKFDWMVWCVLSCCLLFKQKVTWEWECLTLMPSWYEANGSY